MKKGLILIGLCFLLCGCSMNYELEIYNDKYNEQITIDFDSIQLSDKKPTEYIRDELIKIDGSETIEYRELKDIDSNKLFSKYTGRMEEYKDNLTGLATCYDLYKINDYEGVITLLTSKTFNCFDYYQDLDEITVMIKSNHKLIETNADRVDGYKYYWDINKNTKDDEKILLKLKSDEYIFNYENEFVKKVVFILGITGIILIVGFGAYKIATKKMNKANEI